MKRMFCLLLALLLVPLVAFSDDQDPIVGCWYIFYDSYVAPEMSSIFPGTDKSLSILFFNKDGTVYDLYAEIVDDNCTPEYAVAGKWQLINDLYVFSIIGTGRRIVTVTPDALYVKLPDADDLCITYKRMYTFDPYTDYVRK